MEKLKIGKITLGMCQTNCYFVYCEGKKEIIVFDPADRGDYLYEQFQSHGFQVAGICLTHGHFDHIWGLQELKRLSGALVYALEEEKDLLQSEKLNVSRSAGRACVVDADQYVKDGQQVSIAGISFRVIATPGHTKGSCCYYFEDDAILISGDTLFCESVGRTDLPTGSMSDLIRAVREKLLVLPDAVQVYPGHGERTSIGYEKENNSFL